MRILRAVFNKGAIKAALLVLSMTLPFSGAGGEPERLNNFVVELASAELAGPRADNRLDVRMDMEGWVYILLEGEGGMRLNLAGPDGMETVLDGSGEAMRYMPEGPFTLIVDADRRARPARLTARRVAEVKAYNIEGHEPDDPSVCIRYPWDFWKKAFLHSANVATSRPSGAYEPYARSWQEDGRRWLRRQSIRPLWDEDVDPAGFFSEILGGQVWDGAVLDELLPRDGPHYERYGDGLERFSLSPEGRGKQVYWWIWSLGTRGSYSARRVLETAAQDVARSFRVTGEARVSGDRSLKVLSRGEGAARTRQLNINLEPGEEYTLSAYLRGEGVVNRSRTGLFVIDQGWHNEYGAIQPAEGDSSWKRYESSFTPRSGGDYQLLIEIPEEGDFWIDAVQLERGGAATEFAVGGRNKISNPDFRSGLFKWQAGAGESLPLIDAAVKHGHAFIQEMYLLSEPSEELAAERIERPLEIMAEAFRLYDGPLQRHVLIAPLLYDAKPGVYCGNFYPHVDYKVFLDMQMHAMATREGLEDLRGVGMWAGHYAGPETLRWFGELVRHYCIEGAVEPLSRDPYMLPHLVNSGFDEGAAGWDVSGKVDAVKVQDMPSGGHVGERRQISVPRGTVLRTVRGPGDGPNSFGQKIRNLEPGRLYSLRVYSAGPGYTDRPVKAGITIEGAGVRAEGESGGEFSEDKWTHVWRTQRRPEEVYWTLHYRVFRAVREEHYLAVSDVEPGEAYWDFVQVSPYFE